MTRATRPSLVRLMRTPVLAPILADRRLAAACCGMAALLLVGQRFGVALWRCPMLAATGIECPGCGLTRAIGRLIRGDWAGAVMLHPFAPAFVVVLALCATAAMLPAERRSRLAGTIERFEHSTAICTMGLLLLIAWWALRVWG